MLYKYTRHSQEADETGKSHKGVCNIILHKQIFHSGQKVIVCCVQTLGVPVSLWTSTPCCHPSLYVSLWASFTLGHSLLYVSWQRTNLRCSSLCRIDFGPSRARISPTCCRLGTPRAQRCSSAWTRLLGGHRCLRPGCWRGRLQPKPQRHTPSSSRWWMSATLRPEPPYR